MIPNLKVGVMGIAGSLVGGDRSEQIPGSFPTIYGGVEARGEVSGFSREEGRAILAGRFPRDLRKRRTAFSDRKGIPFSLPTRMQCDFGACITWRCWILGW